MIKCPEVGCNGVYPSLREFVRHCRVSHLGGRFEKEELEPNGFEWNEPRGESKTIAAIFKTLAHPARLAALRALNDRPLAFKELFPSTPIGTKTYHIRELAASRLIKKDGINLIGNYRITAFGLFVLNGVDNILKGADK